MKSHTFSRISYILLTVISAASLVSCSANDDSAAGGNKLAGNTPISDKISESNDDVAASNASKDADHAASNAAVDTSVKDMPGDSFSDTDAAVSAKADSYVYNRLNRVYTTVYDSEGSTKSCRFYLIDGLLTMESCYYIEGSLYTYSAAEVYPDEPKILFEATKDNISFTATLLSFSGFSMAGEYDPFETKVNISLDKDSLTISDEKESITYTPDSKNSSFHASTDVLYEDNSFSKDNGIYSGCYSSISENEYGEHVYRYISFKDNSMITVQEKTCGHPVATHIGNYAIDSNGNIHTLTERLGYGEVPSEGELSISIKNDKLYLVDEGNTYFGDISEICFNHFDLARQADFMHPKDTICTDILGHGYNLPLSYASDEPFDLSSYPDLALESEYDDAQIASAESIIEGKCNTNYAKSAATFIPIQGKGTTQTVICDSMSSARIITSTVKDDCTNIYDFMKSYGYTDFELDFIYDAFNEPLMPGTLNRPIYVTVMIKDKIYTYYFYDDQLIKRKAPEGTSVRPKVNDFIQTIYKIGCYYGNVIDEELKSASLGIYSLDSYKMNTPRVEITCKDIDSGATQTYILDAHTRFAKSCDKSAFSDLKSSESPYEWFERLYTIVSKDGFEEGDGIYATSLLGILDVSLSGNHIDTIDGFYWWD